MLNLTTFLKTLEEKGSARIIQETDKENLSICFEIQVRGDDNIATEAYYKEINCDSKEADESSTKVGLITGYDVPSILSEVIASDIKSQKVIIDSSNNQKPSRLALNYINNLGASMLSISNHKLVCSHCTNDTYLTKYLLESASAIDGDISIEEIEKLENKFFERHNLIKTTGDILSNKETESSTYTETAYKWIDLYEDRKSLSLKCS